MATGLTEPAGSPMNGTRLVPFQLGPKLDTRQIAEGWVDVHKFGGRGGGDAFGAGAGCGQNQWRAGSLLVVGVFAEHTVVAQVPAVVAPHGEHIVVALGEGCLLKGIEHLADVGLSARLSLWHLS